MKKHPTDDLFARKLRQAEIKPRPEAWESLQARLQTKKVRLAWWQQRGPWLAAAGLSLLLIASWAVWQNRSTNEVQVAQNEPPKTLPKQAVQPSNKAQTTPLTIEKNVAQNQVLKTTPRNVKPNDLRKNTIAIPTQKVAPNAMPSNLAQTPTNAPETPQIKPESTPTAPTIAQIQPNLPQPVAQKTIVLQLPEMPVAEIAEVPFPQSTPSKDNRKAPSRFARILRQAQNAKEGQRVDWDEVGVNPNKLLAKVTRRNETE